MKAASYREAVEWIGGNDDPMTMRVADVDSQMTTKLVGDIFGVPSLRVAQAVVRLRRKWAKAKGWK